MKDPQSKFLLKLGVGTALIYLAWLAPGMYSVDCNGMLAVAESICTKHSVAVPAGLGIPGRGGLLYSNWYPLLSILAVPFVEVGRILAHLVRMPFHYVAAIFALALEGLIAAAAVAMVAGLALRLGSDRAGARLAAVSYAFGTIALAYARTFHSEPLLALLTMASLFYAMQNANKGVGYSSACSALAVLAKPTGIVVGPIVAAYFLLKRRDARAALLGVGGTLAGLSLYCAYNYYRFEHLFAFGQPNVFSLSNVPAGLLGLVASPGWGLVWFCPPLLLAIPGARKALEKCRLEGFALLVVFLTYLLVYSLWLEWRGGWAWGPRLLMPAIAVMAPVTGLLTGRLRHALVILTVLGFIINAPTLFSYYQRYYSERNDQGLSMDAWDLQTSPILHAWPAAFRETRDALDTPVTGLVNGLDSGPSNHVATSKALRVIALWWWFLPVAHIARWVGMAVSAVLTSLGIWLIAASTRGTKREPVGTLAEERVDSPLPASSF